MPRNKDDETLMPRLLKRPEAESDLDEIWWYIAQDSPHNADRFLERIQERGSALADFPQMGTRRDELVERQSECVSCAAREWFTIEKSGHSL